MYASAPHARTPLALHRLLTTRPAPLQSADARHSSTLPCPPPALTRSTWTSPARTRTASRRTARAAPSPRARTCSFAATSSTSTWTAHTCVFARAFALVRPPTRPNPGSSPTPSPPSAPEANARPRTPLTLACLDGLRRCDFVNPTPDAGETDIRNVADKIFLERASKGTLEAYQRVMNNVLNRTGSVIELSDGSTEDEKRIIIGFRCVLRPQRDGPRFVEGGGTHADGPDLCALGARAGGCAAVARRSAISLRSRICTTTTTCTRPGNTSVRSSAAPQRTTLLSPSCV